MYVRTIVLAAALLATIEAFGDLVNTVVVNGNEIRISSAGGASSSKGIDFSATFYSAMCGLGRVNCVPSVTIPVTWDDRGTTFVVTEANSVDHGLDAAAWQALDDTITNPAYNILYWDLSPELKSGGSIHTGPPHPRIINFDLERIEVNFTMDFANYGFRHTLIGTGVAVPEPTSVMMVMVISLAACLPRSCRPALRHPRSADWRCPRCSTHQ